MNKTITIALAGFSIIIEEEAYFNLYQYFIALRTSLEPDEAEEVMHDIELRVYEILKEKLHSDKREVVNNNDIAFVISLMGTPEQINNQEETPTSMNFHQNKRQLFRNPNDRIISGVAAGIAAYVNIKSIWVRLFFILFSFTLISIVIYITLWIIMPEAQSSTDMLRMKGQSLNFENIKEQSIKLARRADNEISEALNGISPIINKIAHIIKEGMTAIFKLIGYIFGSLCFIIALTLIGGIVLGITVSSLQETSILANLNFFVENQLIVWISLITAILFISLLFTLFMFLGIKCIAPKRNIPHIGWILGVLALGSFFGGIICVSFPIQIASKNNGHWVQSTKKINFNTPLDTLIIKQLDTSFVGNYKKYWGDIQSDGENMVITTKKYIEIDTTSENRVTLEITTGKIQNNKFSIPVEVKNNTIIIPNKYKITADNKFNQPYLEIKLLVPKNKTIEIDPNLNIDEGKKQLINSIFSANKRTKNK